jgi:hypothetical protein
MRRTVPLIVVPLSGVLLAICAEYCAMLALLLGLQAP